MSGAIDEAQRLLSAWRGRRVWATVFGPRAGFAACGIRARPLLTTFVLRQKRNSSGLPRTSPKHQQRNRHHDFHLLLHPLRSRPVVGKHRQPRDGSVGNGVPRCDIGFRRNGRTDLHRHRLRRRVPARIRVAAPPHADSRRCRHHPRHTRLRASLRRVRQAIDGAGLRRLCARPSRPCPFGRPASALRLDGATGGRHRPRGGDGPACLSERAGVRVRPQPRWPRDHAVRPGARRQAQGRGSQRRCTPAPQERRRLRRWCREGRRCHRAGPEDRQGRRQRVFARSAGDGAACRRPAGDARQPAGRNGRIIDQGHGRGAGPCSRTAHALPRDVRARRQDQPHRGQRHADPGHQQQRQVTEGLSQGLPRHAARARTRPDRRRRDRLVECAQLRKLAQGVKAAEGLVIGSGVQRIAISCAAPPCVGCHIRVAAAHNAAALRD